MFERILRLSKNGANAKEEILTGVSAFMTMVYSLAVNPSIHADAGMDPAVVQLASALCAQIHVFVIWNASLWRRCQFEF